MPADPPTLCRLRDLARWSGLDAWKLRALAEAGALGGGALWPGGRRFYLREWARHIILGAPAPDSPFGTEPRSELLRSYDVCQWTGLTADQLRWAALHLPGDDLTITIRRWPYYRRAILRRRLFEPLLPHGNKA